MQCLIAVGDQQSALSLLTDIEIHSDIKIVLSSHDLISNISSLKSKV